MPATMQVEPYLFFEGRCDEALEFYRHALDAEVLALMRGKDSPDPAMVPPGGENKVIHARIRIGETLLMASDKTFFSPRWGMVADRFGVAWMIYVVPVGGARSEELARQFEAKAQVRDGESWTTHDKESQR